MKILGILAEYNPFHEGHAHQLREARLRSGADFCVIAMSGNYVQRGEPAVYPERMRAGTALEHGADLVVSLPPQAALTSAEGYAYAGMRLLYDCGCDVISFGVESLSDYSTLTEIAAILTDEPDDYKAALSAALKTGVSFPAAREQALFSRIDASVLRTPNHILAVEYLKAADRIEKETGHTLRFLPVQRIDTPCASMIRKTLPDGIRPDDFSLLLHERLIHFTGNHSDTDERILSLREQYISFTQFTGLLKNKSCTYTGISRKLMRLILDLDDREASVPYIRVLGFKKEAVPLLSQLKKHTSLPVLINLPEDLCALSEPALSYYEKSLTADQIYRCIQVAKSGAALPHPYRDPVLKV